jgi:hypothetical protein
MTRHKSPYAMLPPVLNVQLESGMDIMIARNTARRAASLLGFAPARQAQLASVAATLGELVLKTGAAHTLNFNGVSNGDKTGIQLSVATPWLANVAVGNVMIALRQKLGDLIDEIIVEGDEVPTIVTVMWRNENENVHAHSDD